MERDPYLDVLSHQPLQHGPHVLHHAVDVQLARFKDLLAAEGQQLPGQSRGALPGLLDLLDAVANLICRPQVGEQHVAVAVDHRQQVVEVVCNAARQPAHGLHLVGLRELALQVIPFGLHTLCAR